MLCRIFYVLCGVQCTCAVKCCFAFRLCYMVRISLVVSCDISLMPVLSFSGVVLPFVCVIVYFIRCFICVVFRWC
ncbi:hypothetical protein C2G38_2116937, partial [Gigaspora rosea]